MSYKRLTWQHDFEEKSELQLKEAFVSFGWRAERLKYDYGEDLIGRQFENGNPTGKDFYIQLKGTDNIQQYQLTKSRVLSYEIELVNLNQWFSYSLPVILIIWDITNRVGYWLHVQPFIQEILYKQPQWLENTSNAKKPKRNIQIPLEKIIKINVVESLKEIIEIEWKKIRLGKFHFEILYKASEIQLGKEFDGNLSPEIDRQIKITQSKINLKIDPKNLINLLNLAALYYQNNNLCEALKIINQAWEIDQEERLIKQLKACIMAEYAVMHDNPPSMLYEAISLFEVVGDKIDSLAAYNIGNCYSALSQNETAIQYFNKALNQELEPEQLAKIWNNHGQSLVEIGKFDDARISFNKALSFNPSLWNAYSSLAHLEKELNNHESACDYFEMAFQLNSDLEADGDSHLYCYACSLIQLGRYKEALKNIDKLLSVYPIHTLGVKAKAYILSRLRRVDNSFTKESLKFFKERLLDDHSDMLARSELNLIYLDLGFEKERILLLKETIQLDDEPVMVLYDYAMLLEKEGCFDEAITYLEKALVKECNHPMFHSIARLNKRIEKYEKAVEYYELALIDACQPLLILSEISDCYYLLTDYKNDLLVITRAFLLDADEDYWWNNLFFVLDKLNIDLDNYFGFLFGLQELQFLEEENLSNKDIREKLDVLMKNQTH
jgi:tetratricopeptide (TPR) repeat protein